VSLRPSTLLVILALLSVGACALVPNEIPAASGDQVHPAVVFDIDGTLTPRPYEFLTTRMNAVSAVKLYADKGYQIVYLSARSNYARAGTLTWLRRNKFPDGITNVAESAADGKDPAKYKTRMLKALISKGWQIEYAYGDSSTDFTAYASVPIPPDHVFGLRRAGQSHCQPGPVADCLHGWTAHLAYIALVPPGPVKDGVAGNEK